MIIKIIYIKEYKLKKIKKVIEKIENQRKPYLRLVKNKKDE